MRSASPNAAAISNARRRRSADTSMQRPSCCSHTARTMSKTSTSFVSIGKLNVMAAKARPVACPPRHRAGSGRRPRSHRGKAPSMSRVNDGWEPRPLTACRARYHGRGARRHLWVAVPRAATGRIHVAGGKEQETIQTRSRPAVLRRPSAARLRSFPSANLSRTSKDVARVTTDANERPAPSGAGARQAHQYSSLHRVIR